MIGVVKHWSRIQATRALSTESECAVVMGATGLGMPSLSDVGSSERGFQRGSSSFQERLWNKNLLVLRY